MKASRARHGRRRCCLAPCSSCSARPVSCRSSTNAPPAAAPGRAVAFSAARGGLACQNCLAEGVPVTPEAVSALTTALSTAARHSARDATAEGVEEALRHVHNLYSYHTGQRLRSLHFARA